MICSTDAHDMLEQKCRIFRAVWLVRGLKPKRRQFNLLQLTSTVIFRNNPLTSTGLGWLTFNQSWVWAEGVIWACQQFSWTKGQSKMADWLLVLS